MNKLLLAVPILALLSIGTFFIVSQNKNTEVSENKNGAVSQNKYKVHLCLEESSSANSISIHDWQSCYHTQKIKICDDKSDPNVSLCYKAAIDASNLFHHGASGELAACKNFYTYFEKAQSHDPLNKNNWYHDCFTDCRVLTAAQESSFYFNYHYKPIYLTCAGY